MVKEQEAVNASLKTYTNTGQKISTNTLGNRKGSKPLRPERMELYNSQQTMEFDSNRLASGEDESHVSSKNKVRNFVFQADAQERLLPPPA